MPRELTQPRTFSSSSGRLRLDTLVKLRWLAIAGQTIAIFIVFAGFGVRLPLVPCLVVIGLSAVLNTALRLIYPVTQRLDHRRAVLLLGFDILQLAALLAMTGGLENPFSVLFLAPVLISATNLPPALTTLLGLLAFVCSSLLAFFHLPLPLPNGAPGLPPLYVAGVWVALGLALVFISAYAWRVAEEGRQLSEALAATELVLAREQHVSALDGLAAAAAHELGTPLATIRLVARELERAMPADGPYREDVILLREQVDRCRDILQKLTSLHEDEAPHEHMSIRHLIEDVVAPHREFGVEIAINSARGDDEPVGRRNPGVLYGLGNLVENAVDFAQSRVWIDCGWNADNVSITITDDGPGFSPEVLARLGEPYLTTRSRRPETDMERPGLGLGVFIAKTLLERSGASMGFENGAQGAIVRIVWPRFAFERGSKQIIKT
ncbi:ActS/PrrB/RegB family redox-sensitive histidine kinase [Terrihabitans sp. B22-R8]|uniref:ActS/PrrB/RegB family redox-sensitive histidine kinase n=1 Tax=Terrihabitans sp. B22-R8 TaxID=3425128 RepID=UPI00403D53FE